MRAFLPPEGRAASGLYDNMQQFAVTAAVLERQHHPSAIYYTLNTLHPHLKPAAREVNKTFAFRSAARDHHIAHRNLYLVDIDPVRPSGTSATDEERYHAKNVMYRVREYLLTNGFPAPIVLDTGNGFGLLYGAEAGTPAYTVEWRQVLHYLSSRFNNSQVKIDTCVDNASRISRLPGTWNRKGANTDIRPHRKCTVLEYPPTLEDDSGLRRVSQETVAALGQLWTRGPAHNTRKRTLAIDESDVDAFVAKFSEFLQPGDKIEDGDDVYWPLQSCPFKGAPHRNQNVGKGKTCVRLTSENIGFSCFSDDCHDHTFRDLLALIERKTGRKTNLTIYESDEEKQVARWGGVTLVGADEEDDQVLTVLDYVDDDDEDDDEEDDEDDEVTDTLCFVDLAPAYIKYTAKRLQEDPDPGLARELIEIYFDSLPDKDQNPKSPEQVQKCMPIARVLGSERLDRIKAAKLVAEQAPEPEAKADEQPVQAERLWSYFD